MNIDLVDNLIALEKLSLASDRERVHTARSAFSTHLDNENNKIKLEETESKNLVDELNQVSSSNAVAFNVGVGKNELSSSPVASSFSLFTANGVDNELENVAAIEMVPELDLSFKTTPRDSDVDSALSKQAKNMANQQAAKENKSQISTAREKSAHKKKVIEICSWHRILRLVYVQFKIGCSSLKQASFNIKFIYLRHSKLFSKAQLIVFCKIVVKTLVY